MPAPTTHGVRAFLRNGKLPEGCGHVSREAKRLEELLEEAVLTLRNCITPFDAAVIQSARRNETIFRLLNHYLNNEPTITLDQKLAILRDMRAATTARDKSIGELKINVDPRSNSLTAVYGPEAASE